MKALNLVNCRFGRLTVVKKVEGSKYPSMWVCICECGVEKIVPTPNLRSGKTKSCGCLLKDRLKARFSYGKGISFNNGTKPRDPVKDIYTKRAKENKKSVGSKDPTNVREGDTRPSDLLPGQVLCLRAED